MSFQDFLRCAVQVIAIALAIYYCIVFLRGTRGSQVFLGLLAVLVLCVFVWLFDLTELSVILSGLAPLVPCALCVVYQPELRRLFAGIGERARTGAISSESVIETIVRAVGLLSEAKVGALIAFERGASLRPYEQHGRRLDIPLIGDLLASVFFPNGPLHDGAVVIRNGRIEAAGCVFPVAIGKGERRNYGTRHRAAIAISEETDAVAVVVSEETGLVSLAVKGDLERGLKLEELRTRLADLLLSSGHSAAPVPEENHP